MNWGCLAAAWLGFNALVLLGAVVRAWRRRNDPDAEEE